MKTKIKKIIQQSNYIWNIIGILTSSFLSFLLIIIVTRISGINKSGIFSFSYTIALVVYSLACYGGRIYQSTDKKQKISDSTYLTAKIITSIITSFFLLIFIILNNYTGEKLLLIIVLSFAKIIEAFSENFYGIIQRNDRLDIVGKSLFIKSLLSVIIFYYVMNKTENLILSSFVLLIINITILIIYDIRKSRKYSKSIIKFDKKILSFLAGQKHLFLFNIIIMLILNAPRYIVDLKLNNKLLGYFGIIMMIPTGITLFAQFIIQPELVKLSDTYESKKYTNFLRIIFKQILYVMIFGSLCVVGTYLFLPIIFNKIYGIDFSSYKLILSLMVLGGIFNTMTTILSTGLTIMKKTKIQVKIYIIVLIICIALTTILIEKYSLNGALSGYIISMLIQLVIFSWYFHKKIKQKITKQTIKYIYVGNPYPKKYIKNKNFSNKHFSIADDKAQNSLIKGMYEKYKDDLYILTISQNFDYENNNKKILKRKKIKLDCGVNAIAIENMQLNSSLFYLSIMISTIINIIKLMKNIKKTNKNVKFVIITYTPSIYHTLGPIIASKIYNTKKICFLVGPILFPNYKGLNKLINKMSILTIKDFDGTITYVAKSSIDYTNKPYIEILYSLTNEEMEYSNISNIKKIQAKKIVTYTGALESKNGIEMLLKLVPILPNNYVIRIYGDGVLRHEVEKISNKNKDKLQYYGNIDTKEIPKVLKESDLLLLFRMENNKNNEYFSKYAASGKLTEYLLSGIPILTFKNESINKNIIEYLNYVDTSNIKEINDKIIDILKKTNYDKALKKSKAGKKFVEREALEEYQNRKICEFIEKITNNEE